jgi:hypothetical protein
MITFIMVEFSLALVCCLLLLLRSVEYILDR